VDTHASFSELERSVEWNVVSAGFSRMRSSVRRWIGSRAAAYRRDGSPPSWGFTRRFFGDDLRSIEPAPVGFIPLDWGNLLKGSTYGVEAWGDYQVTAWWRLSASYNWLSEHFKFKPGASGLLGVRQLGDDPAHQASLRSSMNVGRAFTLDADLRYAGQLPDPHVASFVELNGRIGWRISETVTLSLSGFNLLHDHHMEFPGADAVPRSMMAGLQWRY
jgi:iron complex outermembrane receptor protein